MDWIKYDIYTTTKEADWIGSILAECGIPGYEITDHVPLTAEEEKQMFTDIPAAMEPNDGKSILTFYTEAPGNEEKAFFSTGSSLRDENTDLPAAIPPEEMIAQILQKIRAQSTENPITVPKITYEVQSDSLWKDKWKENFRPFYAAENVLIKPTWEPIPDDTKPEDIIIEIDPGSAFGTGTHETTRLCLTALRKYITPDTRILDAGCGSGILAIAALLCGANSAFCLDIDPLAIEGTLENAAINQIAENRIAAVQANILENSTALLNQYAGQFDIAVANILADVIIPLSSQIGGFLKKDGIFISSGILTEKAEEVKKALLDHHFEIIEENTLGNWTAFCAKKVQN